MWSAFSRPPCGPQQRGPGRERGSGTAYLTDYAYCVDVRKKSTYIHRRNVFYTSQPPRTPMVQLLPRFPVAAYFSLFTSMPHGRHSPLRLLGLPFPAG
ncbi:hypothetical protein VTH06DRAFT_2696 [Thermothelomyces fergusii]